jgi:putative polyhydroxyalkanoate system protein
MATIDVCRTHGKPLDEARAAVEGLAAKMAERFAVQCAWEGDTLHFQRPGVDGHIALSADAVRVHAHLGFLLTALKGPIEAEIHRVLDEQFS